MCDGQNRTLQNYLREQPDNFKVLLYCFFLLSFPSPPPSTLYVYSYAIIFLSFKTVNVVAEVTAFLHAYTADLSQGNLHEISQILQALIEMCVGSVENQQVIYDKLVVDPLNRILQLPLDDMHNHCRVDEPQKVRALIAIYV